MPMTLSQVQALVAGGESETVEFKKSTASLARAGESLCALLNGGGGTVLIGILRCSLEPVRLRSREVVHSRIALAPTR